MPTELANTNTSKGLPSANDLMEALALLRSPQELERVKRYFRESDNADNQFMGVRMGQIFDLAKASKHMELSEVSKLLDSPFYEARMAAVSIMDFKARDKKTSKEVKKEIFQLYLDKHDRINNWDLVDRSAVHVVGAYLADQPRDILETLARSPDVWRRRTAIVCTHFFIKKGDLDDTFKIAEILLSDLHDLIQKAVGSWLREAGKKDPQRLQNFLEKHGAQMPKVMLRTVMS